MKSWVTTLDYKLYDIEIVKIKMILSETMTINRKLIRSGCPQLHLKNFNFMAHKGVEMIIGSGPPSDSDESAMILFLEYFARSRGITVSAMLPWATEVYRKLCTIGATYIKATVFGITILNQNLQ